MNWYKTRSVILLSLQFILGAVFMVSAISKLFAIDNLEFSIVTELDLRWIWAKIAARLIIVFELFLGLHLILFQRQNRNKTASFVLLTIFTIYLGVIYLLRGNESDCGCFGGLITLSTSQSILKNIVLLAINGIIFLDNGISAPLSSKLREILQIMMLAFSFLLVFIFEPLSFATESQKPPAEIRWDILYNTTRNPKPEVNLAEGKHIIAFLSTSCIYCKRAALKLGMLHRRYPGVSLWFIINGDDEDIKRFLKLTKCEDVPHSKFLGKDFITMAGNILPSIIWVENGKPVHKKYFEEALEDDFEKWDK
jgi:hypothetical protein